MKFGAGFVVAAVLFALGAPGASAQSFPSKPVRIVVPYPAGGAVDIIVRALTDRLRDKWGGAPLVTDLLGGHVPMAFLSVQLGQQGISAGKLRAIAFATKARHPRYPDIPTVDESGVKGFEAVSWYGIFAPAGTPKDVLAKINADIQSVWSSAEFQQKVVEPRILGTLAGSPDEFAAFVAAESAKWKKVVEQSNLKIN